MDRLPIRKQTKKKKSRENKMNPFSCLLRYAEGTLVLLFNLLTTGGEGRRRRNSVIVYIAQESVSVLKFIELSTSSVLAKSVLAGCGVARQRSSAGLRCLVTPTELSQVRRRVRREEFTACLFPLSIFFV